MAVYKLGSEEATAVPTVQCCHCSLAWEDISTITNRDGSISFASMGNVKQTSIGGTPSWKVGTELPSSLVALWVTPLLSMLPDSGVVVPSWKRGPPGSSFSGL